MFLKLIYVVLLVAGHCGATSAGGYHDPSLGILMAVLNSTGDMGPSTEAQYSPPSYTHHLAMYHDPSYYPNNESFVVGIAPLCIAYSFTTTSQSLSMYVSDLTKAIVGNTSAVYGDGVLPQKVSERMDYDVYLPSPTTPTGRAFIYAMQRSGQSSTFTKATAYPPTTFGQKPPTVLGTTDAVLAALSSSSSNNRGPEALGVVSYAEAVKWGLPCMKIRLPRVNDLDAVVSPRLKIIDPYKIDIATSMVGLSSAAQVAYPLVGVVTLHARSSAACNESVHDSHTVLKYLLLNNAVPSAFRFAGFLTLNTNDGNSVLAVALSTLCMPVNVIPSGGSSAIQPVMTAWIRQYATKTPSITVYPAGGSGVGINKTLTKAFVFGASDAVLTQPSYDYLPSVQMLPSVALAVSIVVNFGEDVTLRIPRCALVPLLNGTITRWNHAWLQKANPTLSLPNAAVTVIVRSDSSGTTEVTLNGLLELDKECNDGRALFQSGTLWPFTNTVVRASGSGGVADLVQRTKYSVSYLSTPVAISGGFSQIQLLNEMTNIVSSASGDSVVQRLTSASIDSQSMEVVFKPSINSYPLVGITYFLFDTQGMPDCGVYAEGMRFLRWVLMSQEAASLTVTNNFIPLPNSIAVAADAVIEQRAHCNGNPVFPPPSPPPEGINIVMVVCVVVGILVVIAIPVGWKMSANHRRMALLLNNDRVATELAESISTMSLEDVEYLNEISEPTRIQAAFIKIVKTLKEYRSYLPASLLNVNAGADDDADDNASTVPSSSAPQSVSTQEKSPKRGDNLSQNSHHKTPVTAMTVTKKRITFSVCNVRNWHGLNLTPSNIADVHTRYVQVLRDSVVTTKGTPDVFLGDRFLATWNTVRPIGVHRTASLNAFLASSKALDILELTYGASCGDAIVGNMGCDGMKKYSYVGKCSSLAPMLERLNRTYGTHCLIDQSIEEEAVNA
eukprot:PhF_6_TR7987/c1_g1_i3/m.12241